MSFYIITIFYSYYMDKRIEIFHEKLSHFRFTQGYEEIKEAYVNDIIRFSAARKILTMSHNIQDIIDMYDDIHININVKIDIE